MRIKYVSFFLLFLFCTTFQINAQNKISYLIIGYVSDTSGNGIGNVNISFSNGVGATTNSLGYFQLNLKRPKAQLEITHIGYETKHETIEFNNNGVIADTIFLNIQIEPKIYRS